MTKQTISPERIRIANERTYRIMQRTTDMRRADAGYDEAREDFLAAVRRIPSDAAESRRIPALERALAAFDAALTPKGKK